METEFEDIKIVSFDAEASYKSDPSSPLTNAVLKLSASAPHEWADHFNQGWAEHFYMMKRNASASGDRIEVYCVPDELQNLIREMNKVISKTNEAFRQHLASTQQRASQQAEAAAAEKERLAQIKSNLKFD
jgi:hypothetical protein